jgi:hypothetical protein
VLPGSPWLNAFSVYKNKKEIDMSYDTYVNEGYQYLEETERYLKRTEKRNLPYKETLIAKMYENKGINAEPRNTEGWRNATKTNLQRNKSKQRAGISSLCSAFIGTSGLGHISE